MNSEDGEATPKKLNLFDYTEEELLEEQTLTHYDILNVPLHASSDNVKKAYRKASLKYHPDKTGRGSEDYVFLAVKAAYDTLMDPAKRQAYDSTALPFDDAIPPARASLLQDDTLMYKDEDFYALYEPVFLRNLRFDALLRPEAVKRKSVSGKKEQKSKGPPSLGDENTPMEQVHAFYEYWIHFSSWRDFSAQAMDELQVENELENAESRFEKRWIQKEVDKRAKQLKKQEMSRIQQLVERAMEADPRLRRERQEQVEAKERAKQERIDAQKRQKEEALAAAEQKIKDEEEERIRKAEEKIQREKDKKALRKARQSLRKLTSASFDSLGDTDEPMWADSYDMSQDVEVLCTNLSMGQLLRLSAKYETIETPESALQMIQDRVAKVKAGDLTDALDEGASDEEEGTSAEVTSENGAGSTPEENGASHAGNGSTPDEPVTTTSTKPGPWTKEELSALAKAVKKYPPGGASRWEQIALFVNNLCKQHNPRSKEECIEKYNNIARNAGKPADPQRSTSTVSEAATDTSESGWTPEQDQLLQDALVEYPATMDKNERWTMIAKAVEGKTKKDCVQRFKAIRDALKSRK